MGSELWFMLHLQRKKADILPFMRTWPKALVPFCRRYLQCRYIWFMMYIMVLSLINFMETTQEPFCQMVFQDLFYAEDLSLSWAVISEHVFLSSKRAQEARLFSEFNNEVFSAKRIDYTFVFRKVWGLCRFLEYFEHLAKYLCITLYFISVSSHIKK